MAYPVARDMTRLSGSFGSRKPILLSNGQMSPSFHGGVDFTPTVKSSPLPVYAVGAGTIYGINLGSGAAGRNVMLKLADGSLWWYGHLSRVDVTKGQRVADGEQVGLMGATGNTTGVHLHLERHWPRIDVETDPWPFIANEPDPLGKSADKAASPGPPTPLEEDDMYTDQDRARDDATYGWLKDVQPKVAEIHAIAKRLEIAAGIHTWALADDTAGLRRMVSNLSNAVTSIPGTGPLGKVELAAGEAERIASAVLDEQHERTRS